VTLAHGEVDFETYSEAGHVWNEAARKWHAPAGAKYKGLRSIGAPAYTEHPTAEVLTCSYRLPPWWPGGGVTRRWRPGLPLPRDLFDYLAAGGVLEAHNAMFERLVWANVCVRRYGWPPLPFYQLICSMAKARVNSLPGGLGDLAKVLRTTPKDPGGKRLLDKFSVPRNPTKADPRTRILPDDEPAEAERLYSYCDDDIAAEGEASAIMPPMTPAELGFWYVDQEINWRGIGVDREGIRDCIAVLEQALDRYGDEFRTLTNGLNPTQLDATKGWLAAHGFHMASMDEEALDDALARLAPHPPGGQSPVRRALEIRQLIGSASVKKLYALELMASCDDTLRDVIVHHGARTGRPTGSGPQPLNLPRTGPDVRWCRSCAQPYRVTAAGCLHCGAPAADGLKAKWPLRPKDLADAPGHSSAVDHALALMRSRSLDLIEYYLGDALKVIGGCLRGLFVARPGYDLIASDYSAIEAVVIAMLAGEQWRIDAFREGKPIYLVGASKITGRTLEEYEAYNLLHGEHHPDRQTIGKVSELACGFGGWIGSYKAFGSTEDDDTIKAQILAWRAASPAIVELWGGQFRGMPWDPARRPEMYGYEGAAIQAVQYPGLVFEHRGIRFQVRDDADPVTRRLMVTLLSGRELTYPRPFLQPSPRWSDQLSLVYWTWNSNPNYGAFGWVPMETYGGRLTENIVQATAHDVLRFAILNLRAAGYPTVLHVYDEIVVEVPHGVGSLEEVERIMAIMPPWAHDWPIRASGGWRGRRYRKG